MEPSFGAIVRGDCVELLPRELALIVCELGRMPTPDSEDDVLGPVTGPQFLCFRGDTSERLGARAHAAQAHAVRPGRRVEDQMVVVVDKAGNQRSAVQVDDPGVRSRERPDIRRRADGGDPVPGDRHSLYDGEVFVDREDLTVDEYGVRCVLAE